MSRRPQRSRFARTLLVCAASPAIFAFACGGPTDAPASGDGAARDTTALTAASTTPASADLIWRNETTGAVVAWRTRDGGATVDSVYGLPTISDLAWGLEATGDFDGNGSTDLAWHYYPTGATVLWLMRDETLLSSVDSEPLPGPGWRFGAAADFDRDGRADLVLRNDQTGETRIRYMNGAAVRETLDAPSAPGLVLIGAGYFDHDTFLDATPELAWHNPSNGALSYWVLTGSLGNEYQLEQTLQRSQPDPTWFPREVADVDGDGKSDIVWQRPSTGESMYWLLNSSNVQVAPSPAAGPEWGLVAARYRHARATYTLNETLAARTSFLQSRDTARLFSVSAPAVADAYAAAHGVARYEVRYGSFDADHLLYLGVTGYDAAGAVRLAVDFSVGQDELQSLYRAFNKGERVNGFNPFNTVGHPQSRAASALGTDARATVDGLEASLQSSLQAAGALRAAPPPPAELAVVINPNTQPPTADDEDRSALSPCLVGLVGLSLAIVGCPAVITGPWGMAVCGLGVAAAVVGGLSCACALGTAPFGSETWNSSLGMDPELCSCERTTGREEAWLGSSPRSSGDATCYTCPEGFVRASRYSCFGGECGTQYFDSCVNCPVGTYTDPEDPNRCVCADGSDPAGTVPLSNGQVVANCPSGVYAVGGFRTRQLTDCHLNWGGCYTSCNPSPWVPGLVGVSPKDALLGVACPMGSGGNLCGGAYHAYCDPEALCDATTRTTNVGFMASFLPPYVDDLLPTMVSCLESEGLRVFVEYLPPRQP